MALSIRKTVHLWTKQEGLCAYCNGTLDEDNVTLDHIIPRSFGGEQSHTRNMVLACLACQKCKSQVEQRVDDDLPTLAQACILISMLTGDMRTVVQRAVDSLRARGTDESFDASFLTPAELQSRWEKENEKESEEDETN